MAIETSIILSAVNKASAVIGEVRGDIEGLNNPSLLSGFNSNLASIGKTLTGVVATGVTAVATALGATAFEGLRFNNSMEQVSAQLMAFLKDGDKVESMLGMIQQRAANTPFAFEEMAKAVTGLIPAATQANIPIERLIGMAEILAASNPAEGLEGAAFALREAVSGDFTSIIERFNLPRSYINQLKEEGVPALDAVAMAMASLGLDTSLVTNLAQTFEGRWSTVKDTFTEVASTLTQPLFDTISAGMGNLLANINQFKPLIDAVVGSFSKLFGNLLSGESLLDSILILVSDLGTTFGLNVREIKNVNDRIKGFFDQLSNGIATVQAFLAPIGEFLAQYVTMKDVLISAGIAIAAFVIPAIAGLIVALAPIIATIAAVVAAVVLFRMAWESNLFGVQQYVKALTDGFGLLWEGIKQLFSGDITAALASFTEGFAVLSEGVGAYLDNVRATILGWVQSIDWAAVGQLVIDGLFGVWGFLSEIVLPYLAGLLAGIMTWATETDWGAVGLGIITKLFNSFVALFETVAPYLTEFIASITAWFNEQDWKQIGYDVTVKILTGIKNLWETTSTFLSEFWANVQGFFNNTDWGELGTTLVEKAVTKIGVFWITAKAKFDSFYASAKSWFATTDWSSLTVSLIDGLIAGIASGVTAVISAAADLASGVSQAIADVWQSNSPSKWAIDKAFTIPQGIVIGLGQGESMVDTAGADLGQAVTNSVTSGMAAGVTDNRQNVYNQTWNVNTNSFSGGREGMAALAFAGGI